MTHYAVYEKGTFNLVHLTSHMVLAVIWQESQLHPDNYEIKLVTIVERKNHV